MRKKANLKHDDLERKFDTVWIWLEGPELVKEYRFHPTRRWRFDRAYPECKVGIEIEGATWAGGRHTREPGYSGDCEKYNEAARLGWRVFRFTRLMLDEPDRYLGPVVEEIK